MYEPAQNRREESRHLFPQSLHLFWWLTVCTVLETLNSKVTQRKLNIQLPNSRTKLVRRNLFLGLYLDASFSLSSFWKWSSDGYAFVTTLYLRYITRLCFVTCNDALKQILFFFDRVEILLRQISCGLNLSKVGFFCAILSTDFFPYK